MISGDTSGAFAVGFGENLVSNNGHLYPFYAGIIAGFLYYVFKLTWQIFIKKKSIPEVSQNGNEIKSDAEFLDNNL